MRAIPRFATLACAGALLALAAAGIVVWRAHRATVPTGAGAVLNPTERVRPPPRTDAVSARALMPETPPPNPTERWRQLAAQPASVERDAELAVTLEELAGRDRNAAVELLRTLSFDDRRNVVRALFIDAALRPAGALQLAAAFCRADPERSRDHGHALVDVLTRAGEYEAAIRFVSQQNETDGESENPVEWLKATFAAWAAEQPQAAGWHTLSLSAGPMREEALQAVTARWAETDAPAAIAFVDALPAGNEHRTAIEAALRIWIERDVGAAAEWLRRAEPRSEFDFAIAFVIARNASTLAPADAAKWAERITSPELRSHVIAQVVSHWSNSNPAEARRYAESALSLSASDRKTVLSALDRPPE